MTKEQIKIIITGAFALAITNGILTNSSGQFLTPIKSDLGFTTAAISFAFSIMYIGTTLAAPFIARFIDKYNPRRCMMLCMGAIAVSTLAFAFSSSLWQFYSCTAIMGIAFLGSSTLSVSVMVNQSFPNKGKGLATSICFAGSGLGGMIFNPLIGHVISALGWRSSFILIGMIFIIGIFLVYFLLKDALLKTKKIQDEWPEEVIEGPHEITHDTKDIKNGIDYKEAIRDTRFWLIAFSFMLLYGIGSGTMLHLVPSLINIGFNPESASMIISATLGVLIIGKLCAGILYEKKGIRLSITLCLVLVVLAMGSLTLIVYANLLFIPFVIFYGMGMSLNTIFLPLLIHHLFGDKDYSKILGTATFVYGIGNFTIPLVSGRIFDVFGSYTPNWILYVFFAFGAFIMIELALKPRAKM